MTNSINCFNPSIEPLREMTTHWWASFEWASSSPGIWVSILHFNWMWEVHEDMAFRGIQSSWDSETWRFATTMPYWYSPRGRAKLMRAHALPLPGTEFFFPFLRIIYQVWDSCHSPAKEHVFYLMPIGLQYYYMLKDSKQHLTLTSHVSCLYTLKAKLFGSQLHQ